MAITTPLTSVIIPNYNYGRYLRQAIDSVLAQSYVRTEILVVDDGSSDESATIVRGYGDRVRWIQQHRAGVSAARNRGVQESHGDLVAFLDADDYWHPRKLERQLARWMNEPTVGFVHCGARILSEIGEVIEVQLDGQEGQIAEEMLLFQRLTVVCTGSSILVPRAIFGDVGGFDTRLSTSADWDLCYRIAVRHRVAFVPEELIVIRRHGTNMHANIRVMEHDMLLAYAKAFQGASAGTLCLRRQSYGNLHMVLGGSFFKAGNFIDAARHIAKSVWLTPTNGVRVLGFPTRCWRRRYARIAPAEGPS